MRHLIPLLLLAATPAAADIHPRYHEQAKAAAANVVILRIETVDDDGLTTVGDCSLRGQIESVERGTRFVPGLPLVVTVPCRRRDAEIPTGATQWQTREDLRPGRRGRVWLDETGEQIIRRYFQLLP